MGTLVLFGSNLGGMLRYLTFLSFVAAALAVDCVEYIPGNTNLIITAPHGGAQRLSCPLRQDGCRDQAGVCRYDSSSDCERDPTCEAVTVTDSNTAEISKDIGSYIFDDLGKKPHIVIMNCGRKYVDVNRDREEATQHCPDAEKAYDAFHELISIVLKGFTGRGLLLDLHGQGHHQNSTEFGYAIEKSYLDAVVSNPQHQFPQGALNDCTVTALISKYVNQGLKPWDVIGGNESLGLLLQNEGFDALPGPKYPVSGQTNYEYFNGGFIVRTYGSHSASDPVDAIQMETPSEVRYEGGPDIQKAFSKALSKAIVSFYRRNFSK